jgi:MoxR-like ATPase
VTCEQILKMQEQVRQVRVDRVVADYVVRLVESARHDPRLRLGLSPRASLTLYRTAQASALVNGRSYVTPDDVKGLAVAVLAHRIVLDTKARYGGVRNESIIEEAMGKVPVPR